MPHARRQTCFARKLRRVPSVQPSQLRSIAAANDGDALHFCSTCAFSAACLGSGFDKSRLGELHVLVEHVGPIAAGDFIFREGDAFEAIAAVRSGAVKTFVTDAAGREQVQGFFLPGEIIGLNAISQSRFPCNAIALETTGLCRFSFPRMATLATRMPGLQRELFRLLSEDIGKAALLGGDYSADERMAAFFVTLSRRYAQRGFSSTRLRLPMSRADIGNYLRLAPETVSRVLRRLQDTGLIRIERREVELLAVAQLRGMAHAILRD
jgi:CRP/FNR family transcriptional regulator